MAAAAVILPKKLGPIISGTSHRCLRLGQPVTEEDLLPEAGPDEQACPSRGRSKRPLPMDDGDDEGLKFGRTAKRSKRASAAGGDKQQQRAAKSGSGGGGAGQQEQSQEEFPLKALVDSGLLRPGSRRLSIIVKGNSIAAGLMRNGTISYGGRFFSNPGTFAAHVGKRSSVSSARGRGKQGAEEDALGWAAVRYKGRPLESFRAALRDMEDGAGGIGSEEAEEEEEVAEEEEQEEEGEEQEQEDGEEVHPEGFWILCDGCEEWRIVPDDKWEALGADNLDTWYCEDATWDVREEVPHTAPCTKKPRPKKQSSSARKSSRR